MRKDKEPSKVKIFQYPKERERYGLEVRLFVNVQLGIMILFFLTLIIESYLNHYPKAKMLWVVGILFPLLSIEMILRDFSAKFVYLMTINLYVVFVALGIHFSGSILTPLFCSLF